MEWCKVFFLILFILTCDCEATTRVNFARCAYNGFTCTTNARNNQDVTYQCPATVTDVLIYINQFGSPSNIESLTLKNCQNLTISTRCTADRKNIRSLSIFNINSLYFERIHEAQLPPIVKLENIKYIETIPSATFSQMDKNVTTSCYVPKKDFSELYMKDLIIDTIQTRAFNMPYNFERIIFINVTINRIQTSAMKVTLERRADFQFLNNTVEVVEHLGFQIVGNTATFKNNKFVDVAASAVNGTITNFLFSRNFVNTLQPQSISILSKNVNISHNRIENVKSGALEKIGPGLLEDSKTNFGTLRFNYEFSRNVIGFLEPASIQPDMVAYENVASEFNVKNNELFCSCENLGWMFLKRSYNVDIISAFYDGLLETRNQNNCSNSIKLSQLNINSINRTLFHGKCQENYNLEDLLTAETTTTTRSPDPVRASTAAVSRAKLIPWLTNSTANIFLDIIYVILSLTLTVPLI